MRLYASQAKNAFPTTTGGVVFRLSAEDEFSASSSYRFLLEIYPEQIVNNENSKKSNRKSKIFTDPKIVSLSDITGIERTNVFDYGAFLSANGNSLQISLAASCHSDIEDWLDTIRDVIYEPNKPEISIFGSWMPVILEMGFSKV